MEVEINVEGGYVGEGGFFLKINKCDSTFIREMRVQALQILKNDDEVEN